MVRSNAVLKSFFILLQLSGDKDVIISEVYPQSKQNLGCEGSEFPSSEAKL